MITASAARRALTRKARAESIRSQARAELARAARDERAAAELADPVEATGAEGPRPVRPCRPALDASVFLMLVLVLAAAFLRPAAGRLNRHGRRAARARFGCYAAYTADGSPPAHAPEACDASCHAGTAGVAARPRLPYGRRSRRWRAGPSLRPSERIWRLCERSPCPCADCRQARARDPMEERRPRRLPLSPAEAEQLRIHEAETARELALWQALVWGPEAAAELAQLRPDDRPADSVWARLRLVLDALGLLRSQHDHGPPGIGGVVVLCHPRTGPPALAGAGSRAC
jgi:hypothetical protein